MRVAEILRALSILAPISSLSKEIVDLQFRSLSLRSDDPLDKHDRLRTKCLSKIAVVPRIGRSSSRDVS